jgi:hypothetical protein
MQQAIVKVLQQTNFLFLKYRDNEKLNIKLSYTFCKNLVLASETKQFSQTGYQLCIEHRWFIIRLIVFFMPPTHYEDEFKGPLFQDDDF